MFGSCVHRLVEAQASSTPSAVAVASDAGSLTFGELDERASRLANVLIDHGVTPERMVGVTMEPSVHLMVTLLAVWKAGGVYVPIDPSLPRAVAEAMLADAGIVVLVSAGPSVVDPAGVPVIDLKQLDLSGQPANSPFVRLDPANLAYCAFTSGSTGTPKRVGVTHASLANHAVSLGSELGLGPADRVLQSTSIGIDAALEEIIPPWLAGGGVVMPAQRRSTSVELTELIERHGVTVVSLASAYWHQWVDDLNAGRVRLPACVRLVFVGGDKILVDKLAEWCRVPGADQVEWVADYGPTEATISVTLHRPERGFVADPDASSGALVPLGRSFAGSSIYVLDDDLKHAPVDEPGDIWIAGPALARGYVAAPAATAARFRPDPYGPAGTRMYRTGDRGARLTDGTLIFLGRSDRQVKVRGHRVEPGHVESALHRCVGVREVVVEPEDDPGFGSRLTAYVEADASVTEASLRVDLASRVSDWMVPTTIVLVDRMPRSPLNGKIVRSELPPTGGVGAEAAKLADMSALEHVVAILMGAVLDGVVIGRDDDFFLRGGDSLRALQLLSRVDEVTGVAISFKQFHTAPYPRGIADLVTAARGREASGKIVRAEAGDGGRRPTSRGQEALFFLDQVHRGAPTYSIPLCYRIRGLLDVERLSAAVTAVVARHEALRTVFELDGGKLWQRVQPPVDVPTTVVDVDDDAEAIRRAREAAREPFDLKVGPLLRSVVLRVAPDEHIWFLNVHHAVFDAWSLAVLWREITASYEGFPLPSQGLQFGDYAIWQQGWLRGAEADRHRAFWRDELAGDLPALHLGDHSDRATGARGFATEMAADAIDIAAVDRLALDCGTTGFVVLMAAFSVMLHRAGRADEVVVGVPVACRSRSGAEDIIGYLVNTVALRMRFESGMSFRDVVGRADDALADALSHDELPFADAIAGLSRPHRSGASPLFDAMFGMQSTPLDAGSVINGLHIDEAFVHSGTAKVALTWSARRQADGMPGELEFSSGRFDEDSARRWQDGLVALIAAGLSDPSTAINDLPWIIDAHGGDGAAVGAS